MKLLPRRVPMRTKKHVLYTGLALLVAFFLAASALAGQDAAQTKVQADDVAGFKEFSGHVAEYMKLRDSIEKKLPPLKSKEELPEMIAAHQQALARKIREARPHAEPRLLTTEHPRKGVSRKTPRFLKKPKPPPRHCTRHPPAERWSQAGPLAGERDLSGSNRRNNCPGHSFAEAAGTAGRTVLPYLGPYFGPGG